MWIYKLKKGQKENRKHKSLKNKTQILNNQLVIVDKDLNSFYVRNLYIFSEGKYKLSLSVNVKLEN